MVSSISAEGHGNFGNAGSDIEQLLPTLLGYREAMAHIGGGSPRGFWVAVSECTLQDDFQNSYVLSIMA